MGMRWLLLLAMCLYGCATSVESLHENSVSMIKPNSPGCTVAISTGTRNAFYEPIVILAIHPNGEDYWVYFPGRSASNQMDANGNRRGSNIPMWKVLIRGEIKVISGVTCRCPF